ncbi:MAG: dockerin type I repeat-containing protein [Ruminococcus sp.]|nr:dockerin type I repeat-containing protein [Ruminococcus sp.]
MKRVLKKITPSLMSGLMLFSSTYAVVGSANATDNEVQPRGMWAMYGDVNNDGRIDMSDAVCIIQAVKKFEQLTGSLRLPLEYAVARPSVYFVGEGDYVPQAADLDGDNYITENDSLMIQKYCLELPDIGRCGQPFFIN